MVFLQNPQAFDPLHTGLSGTLLIEASAGTGKTHTIASLVARLVVEEGLSIEKILVVTFTEAAAAELKERIYGRLSDMLAALEEKPCQEPFSEAMVTALPLIPLSKPQAKERVLSALRNFDRSLIGTIHAFCLRMLKESRFESGLRFDAELVKNSFPLLKEAAEDVWRTDLVPLGEREARFLVMEKLVPERLARFAESFGKPDQKILPEEKEVAEGLILQEDFERSAELLRNCWQENREFLKAFLLEDPNLNRAILKVATLEKELPGLDQWVPGETHPEILKKLIPDAMVRATKKGKTIPSHPFFDLCGSCVEAWMQFDAARKRARALFLKDLIQKTRERADFLKEKNGIYIFDDLLHVMRNAVQDENGDMANRIRSLFSAALIDEFQDTDTIQYAIFDRVFARAGIPLFLIGDPKQAIYSFRGADVFAYLCAARKSERRYTLRFNWRSDPALIRAVNRVFSQNPRAFLLEGLGFYPVDPAIRERDDFYDARDPFPMKIWTVGSRADGKPANLSDMRADVIHAMAGEVIRLVEGGRAGAIRIGEKGVGPGDIAVLVRSNREAGWIREAFSERGIPAVIQAEGNVLDSPEARDLEILLEAILNPSDAFVLRRALATESMGYSLSKILHVNEDERAFSKILMVFSSARDLWREKGIFPMLMDFYERFEILPRMAAYPMGERRVTNLLHLADILHQAEISENLDSGLLFHWFARQRSADFPGRIEAPLRLESDEKRVRIVTIHKAKGLEYAIVFCPFITEPIGFQKNPEKVLSYHDGPNMEQVIYFDDGTDRNQEEERHLAELRAEGIRLLYVAMTRAVHKLYLVWGNIKNWEKSAAAWLFHGVSGEWPKGEAFPESDLLVLEGEGDIAVSPLPPDEEKHLDPEIDFGEEFARCEHKPLSPEFFRVTSFSSMVAGTASEETRDMDGLAGSRMRQVSGPEGGVFAFPAGSRPGTFLHAVFEEIDFTRDHGHFFETVEKLLTAHGYDSAWASVIAKMVENVLTMPIGPAKLLLRDIPLTDQLREMDFYLPLKSFDPKRLAETVRRLTGEAAGGIPPKLEKIRFSRAEGYLRGIMDLVFRHQGKYYLVDWKSNHLGDVPSDYGPEKLAGEMARHLYTLQYHLYILALDRHLSLHLEEYDYERDFGGVAYVFLRGVDPSHSSVYGLFEDKPPEEKIRALAELLLEEPGKGLSATGI